MLSSVNVSRCLIWWGQRVDFLRPSEPSCFIVCLFFFLHVPATSYESNYDVNAFMCFSCSKRPLNLFWTQQDVHFWTMWKCQSFRTISVLNSQLIVCFWQGCSVENVLGSEIGPLSAFVQVVNRSHTVWMGLEEFV